MKELMLGNEAIARGAWQAGVRVVASYPGTPSTEITEFCSKYPEIDSEWATNEKVALEVAYGAAVAGARAMTCMKHVGVNVAADPLFTAAYTGISAGLVIVCADDPAMHSSQNEQDSRQYARAAHVPMLEPSDSQECLEMVKLAFELSERYDTPVMLRLTTRLAHARSVVLTEDREDVPVRAFASNPVKYVMMPAMARRRHIAVQAREEKMAADAAELPVNRVETRGRMGVICAGAAYQYVREALPDASVFKLGLTHPLPMDAIRAFASKADALYVVEELEPVFEQEIAAAGIPVTGKALTGRQGELSVMRVREAFGLPFTKDEAPNLPARPPVMCPGCPHRATFYAIKKLGLTVFGDIGCYTMAALPPVSCMDQSLCMGASIGMAFGAEKAQGKAFSRHAVAVLGDSTFMHSGMTALLDAVYNGSTITVLVLDNRITGMTGHQQNPGSGFDIHGAPAPELDIGKLCEVMGAHVRTVDPFDLAEMTKALKEETARESVSVIIVRRPCALLLKQRTLPYTATACKNCGACMKLSCPALLRTEHGVRVDETLCVGCGLCAHVCPFGALAPKGGHA